MAGGLSLPPAPGVLTGDDIIRAGACSGGVARRLDRLAGSIAAAEQAARLLTLVPKEERQHVLDASFDQALRSNGANPSDGDGYGDGYGYGYGDGDGYGYGDGDGDGDGYGYGYGDGDGYGYGDRTGAGRSYG